MVYEGGVGGVQKQLSNYLILNSHPGEVSGDDHLYWFIIHDNYGAITTNEFNNAFEVYDKHNTAQNSLDEKAEITDSLEKMITVF